MATVAKKVVEKAQAAGPKGEEVAKPSTAAEVNLAGFSTQELRQLARDVER
jgi:hypothetical protein